MNKAKSQTHTSLKKSTNSDVAKSCSMGSALVSSNLLSESNLANGEAVLNRRKILITGCSSGIGYYAAKKLHQDGHVVVASCRKKEDIESLKKEGLHCVQIDLDETESIDAGIREMLVITGGELDVLINNGAYGQPGAIEDISRSVLEKQFSSNVFGTHELTIKLMRTLLTSDNPRIIQVSSVLGLIALRYRGAYVASKFALEGLTDTLRLELTDTKVKVSLIEPGPIVSKFRQNAQTAFMENIDREKSRHRDKYKIAIKRFSSDKKQPFTLSEDTVYQKINHAITSNRPNPRYYVTKPTYIFGLLRRILPTKALDFILLKISDGENKRFNDK